MQTHYNASEYENFTQDMSKYGFVSLIRESSYKSNCINIKIRKKGDFQGILSSVHEVRDEKKRQLLHHVCPYPLSQKTHCHKKIPIPGTAARLWPFNQPDQITEQGLSYSNYFS